MKWAQTFLNRNDKPEVLDELRELREIDEQETAMEAVRRYMLEVAEPSYSVGQVVRRIGETVRPFSTADEIHRLLERENDPARFATEDQMRRTLEQFQEARRLTEKTLGPAWAAMEKQRAEDARRLQAIVNNPVWIAIEEQRAENARRWLEIANDPPWIAHQRQMEENARRLRAAQARQVNEKTDSETVNQDDKPQDAAEDKADKSS